MSIDDGDKLLHYISRIYHCLKNAIPGTITTGGEKNNFLPLPSQLIRQMRRLFEPIPSSSSPLPAADRLSSPSRGH